MKLLLKIGLLSWLFVGWAGMLACQDEPRKELPQFDSKKDFEERVIAEHKRLIEAENKAINSFIAKLPYDFEKTGTGLRHAVVQEGAGDYAKQGQLAVVAYELRLLDSTLVSAAKAGQPHDFLIGQDNVESGIHEGILKMKKGGSSIFVLPSHLAHGLSGGQNNIPLKATLVYKIELLDLR